MWSPQFLQANWLNNFMKESFEMKILTHEVKKVLAAYEIPRFSIVFRRAR
jgi:hypothetical protein